MSPMVLPVVACYSGCPVFGRNTDNAFPLAAFAPATAKGGPLHEAAAIVGCRRRGAVALCPAGARMTDASDGKRDFFISYNRADRTWAEWIAWQLEQAGRSFIVQAWHFR